MFLDLEFYLIIFILVVLIICVLLGVAFFTLLERKILGYIQIRKGPNKIGYLGILQPFSDAIKLFSKENFFLVLSNFFIYYFSPIFSLFLSLIIWLCLPYSIKFISFMFGILFFFSCLSFRVYSLIIAGWSSNSFYSLLGSLRSIAQTISYEVALILIILNLLFFLLNFNFIYFEIYQLNFWFLFLFFPLSLIWLVSLLAETNRTPFDFAEGESELVSGFNIEYGGGGFALIFLAEYSRIIFISLIFSLMFLGSYLVSFFFFLKVNLLIFLFIWIRGAFPRFRYDKLIFLVWKRFLSVVLLFLFFFISLSFSLFF